VRKNSVGAHDGHVDSVDYNSLRVAVLSISRATRTVFKMAKGTAVPVEHLVIISLLLGLWNLALIFLCIAKIFIILELTSLTHRRENVPSVRF